MDKIELIERIQNVAPRSKRRLIALAGPPASGKSTLADHLGAAIANSCVVPMDGFHLDNEVLHLRGLSTRKGSPQSFDVVGFLHTIKRLQCETEVIYPIFDRKLDRAIAGAGVVGADMQTVIVEGNYLLLDAQGWRELAALWDLTVYLAVTEAVLRSRLMQRWLDHGHTDAQARAKVDANDLPNAMIVADQLLKPQITLTL